MRRKDDPENLVDKTAKVEELIAVAMEKADPQTKKLLTKWKNLNSGIAEKY